MLVSGGSDSVALLLALDEAAKTFEPALRVEAAHFNHALRGEDSDADEEFVAGLAHRLGVPLHVRRWKGESPQLHDRLSISRKPRILRLSVPPWLPCAHTSGLFPNRPVGDYVGRAFRYGFRRKASRGEPTVDQRPTFFLAVETLGINSAHLLFSSPLAHVVCLTTCRHLQRECER